MSKKELASRSNVTAMAITNYENGNRRPDMETMKRLAKVLGVKVSDFLIVRNQNLVFCHGEFRKNSTLTKNQQELVRESVEEYFNRFYTAVELLGGEVLPEPPKCHALPMTEDAEQDALALRKHLNLAEQGPIDDLITTLENKGILIFVYNIKNDKFSGMNGMVNGRPYIVVNGEMTPERNRSTIAHELAHLMFYVPEYLHIDVEKAATAISGAFLFPESDAIRELGYKRRSVTKDMLLVCQEYGISMYLLVTRACIAHIISDSVAKDFYIKAGKNGWKKNEPSRIDAEKPHLFEQLVYRAVNEGDISIQRGAELLQIPYTEVAEHCCFNEG